MRLKFYFLFIDLIDLIDLIDDKYSFYTYSSQITKIRFFK